MRRWCCQPLNNLLLPFLQDIARYETVMLSAIQQPAACLHFLRPGRLVRIREGSLDWGWGIVVSVMRKTVAVNAAVQADDMGPASAYILDLLLSCDAASIKGKKGPFQVASAARCSSHELGEGFAKSLSLL